MDQKEALPTQHHWSRNRKKRTVVLKGGTAPDSNGFRNKFWFKSEEEQNMIWASFKTFKRLKFQHSIVHSFAQAQHRKLYRKPRRAAQETNELLKTQIAEYRIHTVLCEWKRHHNKTYFVVIPYEPIQFQAQAKRSPKVFGFKRKASRTHRSRATGRKRAGTRPTRWPTDTTHQSGKWLSHRPARHPLNDDEIVELFYNLYNPEAVEKKGMDLLKRDVQQTHPARVLKTAYHKDYRERIHERRIRNHSHKNSNGMDKEKHHRTSGTRKRNFLKLGNKFVKRYLFTATPLPSTGGFIVNMPNLLDVSIFKPHGNCYKPKFAQKVAQVQAQIMESEEKACRNLDIRNRHTRHWRYCAIQS